jgi:hypothetical protein
MAVFRHYHTLMHKPTASTATLSEDGKMAEPTDPYYESFIVYTDTDMFTVIQIVYSY